MNFAEMKVDGKEVATRRIPHTVPFILTTYETFDVGIDTRTPVDGKDYQVPFRFAGKLTIKLGPRSHELEKRVQEGRAEVKRASQ